MNDRSRVAATRLTITMALLLLIGAVADPSGIFTIVGWTGGNPAAAVWWWAPYLVYVPLALLFAFFGARTAVADEQDARRWGLVLFRLWGVTVLSIAAAEFFYSLIVIVPMCHGGRFEIPLAEAVAFLLWSSGYAAFKMALIGWIAALVGMFALRSHAVSSAVAPAAPGSAVLAAGGTVLAVALLGRWFALHWWGGSPLGFSYASDAALLTPTPASGVWQYVVALAIVFVCVWRHAASISGRPFWAGLTGGFLASIALLAVQSLQLVFQSNQPSGPGDLWVVPAVFIRAVDAASFALCVGLAAGCMSLISARLRKAPPAAGWILAALALVLAVHAALHFEEVPPYLAARAAAPASEALAGDPEARRLLSVRTGLDGPQIVDALGSTVTLRGVNVNQLGDYYLQDPTLRGAQPLTEQDFTDIAALGLNVVRLTLSWSELEPQPGRISHHYLHRIHQAVDWAKAHQVYVLLDIHQDAWSKYVAAAPKTDCRWGTSPMVGWDGAPQWATLTDDTPPCQVTGRDLAPNVSRAFQSFYFDRDDIQTSLVRVWSVLAHEFAGDANIAGYDLINEPNFGDTPPIASTLMLANYYARSIRAIRRAEDGLANGHHHMVFIEPSIIWSGFGIDNLPPRGWSSDGQIVFSPHLYNESITADQDFGFNLISIERGFALARAAAARLGAPLWIGEWGYFGDPHKQAALLQRQLDAEDAGRIGSAFWVWKQACGDPHVYPGKVAGDIRRASCPDNAELGTSTEITRQLSRPYVRTAPGQIAHVAVAGHAMTLDGTAGSACGLEIWMPGDVKPTVVESISPLEIARVEQGSDALGLSGGWLVSGCVAPGDYRIVLN